MCLFQIINLDSFNSYYILNGKCVYLLTLFLIKKKKRKLEKP